MSRFRVRALWAALHGAVTILSACHARPIATGNGGPPAVSAVVTTVRGSLESVVYAAVTMQFRNASNTTVRLHSYAIDWPAGRFVAEHLAIDLPPGAVVSRTARVDCAPTHCPTVSNARVSIRDFDFTP